LTAADRRKKPAPSMGASMKVRPVVAVV